MYFDDCKESDFVDKLDNVNSDEYYFVLKHEGPLGDSYQSLLLGVIKETGDGYVMNCLEYEVPEKIYMRLMNGFGRLSKMAMDTYTDYWKSTAVELKNVWQRVRQERIPKVKNYLRDMFLYQFKSSKLGLPKRVKLSNDNIIYIKRLSKDEVKLFLEDLGYIPFDESKYVAKQLASSFYNF